MHPFKTFLILLAVLFASPCLAQGGGANPLPADVALYVGPMPIPQAEGPFFTPGSPNKPDARGDVDTVAGWPDFHLTGLVTDLDGDPIPGLKIDFWQTDDQGAYDNTGGYDLRGHVYTDANGLYDYWTVMPANYETIRSRHLHVKIGGDNLGYTTPTYTTQFYWPEPFDADIDADGVRDKIIENGVQTNQDAISNSQDILIQRGLNAIGETVAALSSNLFTINNDPVADGFFDATLDIVMPSVFQAPLPGDADADGDIDDTDLGIAISNFTGPVGAAGGKTFVQGDTDVDGDVDDTDLGVAISGFTGPLAPASVPEPASLALLTLGGLAFCRRK